MYKRNAQGWSKHFDFFLLDEVALQLAFLIAVFLRMRSWAYSVPIYRNYAILLVLVDALTIVLMNSFHNVVNRGYYVEISATVKHAFICFALANAFVFAMKSGDRYSRIILFLTFLLHVLIGYGTRVLWKPFLKKRGRTRQKKVSMLVVAAPESAEAILARLSGDDLAGYRICGVVLTEQTEEKTIGGFPIVSDLDGAADYIVREWVDSVYFDASLRDERVVKLMGDCMKMAVPTHYHVPNLSRTGAKRFSEKIGGTTVLTTSINYATPLQTLLKRCFDILAGLVGSCVALVIIAVVGPKIKKESPGPILFRQERIGKNGQRFKIFKIRSMYMDAEERKKELWSQSRVKDGMMFKMDFDPRIIGNKILPDGTKVTGIGDFIRRTSLDEFPQFFNVLAGSMSTVGDMVIFGQTKKKPVIMRLSVA
ncbi:MAG: sugar transferase [Oscillospiraceae bacterium]|nr:sugar transferase [Oscillospiraceae bacterium]